MEAMQTLSFFVYQYGLILGLPLLVSSRISGSQEHNYLKRYGSSKVRHKSLKLTATWQDTLWEQENGAKKNSKEKIYDVWYQMLLGCPLFRLFFLTCLLSKLLIGRVVWVNKQNIFYYLITCTYTLKVNHILLSQ